ncbi:hypothetical protein [Crenothrix sp.]|uniref:hypothetical protein n=1 Tax=Crenothrix sp. TaxID=3100433 RepID=UPI00374D846A
MNKLFTVFTIATLTGFGSAAHADIYAAGPAYGANPTGGLATCRVINVGTTSVNITLRQIITNTNSILPLSSNTCNVPVAAGDNCAFSAPVGGNFALSCRLFVSGTDPQISGTLDVQNPIGTVRVVVPMQNTNH